MKKVLFRILIICLAICCVLGVFTACDDNGVINNDNNGQQENPIDENDNECQHEYSETIVNPTCTEQGYTLHACKKCGQNYKDTFTDALGHDYVWTTTKQPTETTKGTETGVCSRCQDTITRDIPELNHEHSYTETIVAPTCTAKGYTLHKCSCGYEYKTDETEKIPHTPAAAVEENRIEPKCEENGGYDLVVRCSVCGEELEKEHKSIEKLGHDYGEWYEAKAPSCTEEGELRRVCNNDSTHVETMAISPTGHSFSKDWTTDSGYHWHASACGHNVISERGAHEYKIDVVPVTCETDGYTLHTCTTCGYFYRDNILPATGHAFSSEWTTDSTYHWHTATCGHDVVSGKSAHTFGAATTVVPSCESDGYDYKTCSICGYEYRYNIVPALGHIKSDVKVKTLVKASDSGYGYYTTEFYCERCQKVNSTQYTMIQPSGATVNSARGEWEENTVFSNVPYPENGVCTSLITSTENTAVGNYKGTVGAFFDSITRAQVKAYTQTLKNSGYNKSVTENDYSAYTFTAYHNTLNIFIAVGYDGSEMSIAVYKTGTVKKADNSGSGSSGGTVLHDITATAGLSYSLSDDGKSYSVDGYSGAENYVVIPYYYNGLPVKSINGFKNGSSSNTGVKVVIVLADIETLAANAFTGCTNLVNIDLPASVSAIGKEAFSGCSKLQNFVMPKNIKTVGESAFNNCSSISRVDYAGTTNTWCKIDFGNVYANPAYYAKKLYINGNLFNNLEIASGITEIGAFAFANCIDLNTVTIPASIKTIGKDAFTGCSGIEKVYFNGTLPDWCDMDFGSYYSNPVGNGYLYIQGNSVIDLEIGSSVKEIKPYAFAGYKNLATVTIGGNITEIGNYAFSGCSDLSSVIITSNLKSIGGGAFNNCSVLSEISIPSSIENIGNNAFEDCNSIELTTYDNAKYFGNSDNPYLILLKATNENITSVKTHERTKIIYPYAFEDCDKLTSAEISDSVIQIGDGAFYYCYNLKSLVIGDVEKIGGYVFYGCSALKTVVLGKGVKTIEEEAFENCSQLEKVVYNGTIADWCGITFGNKYANPLFYAHNLYIGDEKVTDLTVQQGVQEINDFAFIGATCLKSVSLPSSVISIGIEAFYNCSNLTNIDIPNGVIDIQTRAFCNCSNLSAITLPAELKTIGGGAFSGCSSLTNIIIPSDVTVVSNSAFFNCIGLKNITFSNNLTTIEAFAFYGCNSLTSVTVPDSVTSIGDSAFYNCSSLTSITIGNSVASIGDDAFEGCNGLNHIIVDSNNTNYSSQDGILYNKLRTYIICVPRKISGDVSLSDTLKSIGNDTFYNCSSLTSIKIGKGVTSIGASAFYNCSGLKSIIMPDSVTSIGEYAFYGCSSLTDITISDSVTSLPQGVLSGCSSLESITIPFVGSSKSATSANSSTLFGHIFGTSSYTGGIATTQYYSSSSYGYRTYYIPSSLTNVTVTGGNILRGAFYNCSSLMSVTVPDSVTSIGDSAFYNCSSLMSITIPDSVTSIGSAAYDGCYKLVEIINKSSLSITKGSTNNGYIGYYALTVHNGESKIVNKNGYLFIKDDEDTNYLFAYIGDEAELTLPSDYNEEEYQIYKYTFEDCSMLTNIIIPDSVTSIGKGAFAGCSGLKEITIPFVGAKEDGTTNTHFGYIFGASSYSNNSSYVPSSLKTVIITGGNSIASYVFYNCSSLTSVTIPDSVTSIGDYAFSGCSSLESIIVHANNSNFSSDSGILYNKSKTSIIVVPKAIRDVIALPDTLTSIGNAFNGCSSLREITIPDSVTSIKDYAFSNCSSLESVTIGNGVTSIGSDAFYNCSSLTSVTIGNSVTSIGYRAFDNCSSLTEIIIPDSVITIGSGAFFGCSSLTSITIPFVGDSGKTARYPFGYIFGTSSYYGSHATTQYYYNDGNRSETYYIPYSLKNVTITGGEIFYRAFQNCFITSVTIGDGIVKIGDFAFYNCTVNNVTISDTVTSINQYAFYGCSNLTNITIGSRVTSIGYVAFHGCSSLTSVYYNGTAADWAKITINSDGDNSKLTSATRYYYSETAPTDTDYNYWHYVDGEIVIWTKEN